MMKGKRLETLLLKQMTDGGLQELHGTSGIICSADLEQVFLHPAQIKQAYDQYVFLEPPYLNWQLSLV